MKNEKEFFSNGEIRVSYQPKKCVNAGICCQGLAEVFRNSVIPWIDLEAASTERIVHQINACPSKALTYEKVEVMEAVK